MRSAHSRGMWHAVALDSSEPSWKQTLNRHLRFGFRRSAPVYTRSLCPARMFWSPVAPHDARHGESPTPLSRCALSFHGHQPDEVLLAGQHLRLEPLERGRERRTPVPPLWGGNEAERRIGRETRRVVEVLVTREAAVDRLPQEIRQSELRVQSVAGVAEVPR